MQTNAARTPSQGPRFHFQRFHEWKNASPLRHARRTAGVSVADCAQFLGAAPTTYRRWQDGETPPSPTTWPALQNLFKAPGLRARYDAWLRRKPRP